MAFQIAFTPATNSKGQVKLTFDGHELYTKEADITDKVTGEVTKEEVEYLKLKFTCMDITRKNPKQMNIIGKPIIGEGTRIGQALTAMGFSLVPTDVSEDEDGFASVEGESDDDDFSISDVSDPSEAIESFLQASVGKSYVAKLKKTDKGFWDIEPTTLEAFVSKKSK